jgi:hypothetical protein
VHVGALECSAGEFLSMTPVNKPRGTGVN